MTSSSKAITIDLSLVTHNSARWVSQFFASLRAQSFPTKQINFYLNDCASTDQTIALIRDEIKQTKFASVHIKKSKNIGFGGGHNNNIRAGRAKFVLATNIDLEYEPDALVNALNIACNDSEDIASWEFRQKPYEHPKIYDPFDLTTSWSSSACILFRRSALEAVGSYDEAIFMYGEDVDLSWRLRTEGYRLRYIPDAVCWHYTYQESRFKERQFIGSILGNLALRFRFGTEQDQIDGEKLSEAALRDIEVNNPTLHKKLFTEIAQLQKKRSHFSNQVKPYRASGVARFLDWDYEHIRKGAFFELKPIPQTDHKVAIIIRTYKGRHQLLQNAVISALNQTYKNIDIVVVEDGGNSAAKTLEKFKDTRIHYYSLPKVGRCGTGNFALSISNAAYFCFLDDDDFLYADHVETLLAEILDHPEYLLAYAAAFEVKTILKNKNGVTAIHREDKPYKHFFHSYSLGKLLIQNLTPIQGVLFSRVLYDRHGGFASDLENLEDWNLWLRYSQSTDFLAIEKTTSAFRTPSDILINDERQKELDDYYSRAISKMSNYHTDRLTYEHLRQLKTGGFPLIQRKSSSPTEDPDSNSLQELEFGVTIHKSDSLFRGHLSHYIQCGTQIASLIEFYAADYSNCKVCDTTPGFGRTARAINLELRKNFTCVCNDIEQIDFLKTQLNVTGILESNFFTHSNEKYHVIHSTLPQKAKTSSQVRSHIAKLSSHLVEEGTLILAIASSPSIWSPKIYQNLNSSYRLDPIKFLPRFWDGVIDIIIFKKFAST